MDLTNHIQSGEVNQELVEQSLSFLLSRVGGVRDKAFELEEKANWPEEEGGEGYDRYSDCGEDDSEPIDVDEVPKAICAGPGGEGTSSTAADIIGKKNEDEEDMPQPVGENDPNKRQKHGK